jgi:hypothetical protein
MQICSESHHHQRERLQVHACVTSDVQMRRASVFHAIKLIQCYCSDIIKARVSQCCVSLCGSGIRILLLSATSIAHCFALCQANFERTFDDIIPAACSADKFVQNRKIIGRELRKALQEAMSEEVAPAHADILAYGIMLSLLREIDNTLLMSVYNFQLRCGNDASCRFLLHWHPY